MIKLLASHRINITRTILPGILFLIASCTNSMKEINEVTGKARVGEDRGKDVTILYSNTVVL